MDQLLGLVDLFLRLGHDETVQVFFLVAGVSGVRTTLSFLDGAFATDSNLGTRLVLHLLQRVATGADEQSNLGLSVSIMCVFQVLGLNVSA